MLKKLFLLIGLLTSAAMWAAEELPSGWKPCPITNLDVQWQKTDDGKNNAIISFTTPTQMESVDQESWETKYEDLPCAITRVDVLRSDYDMNVFQVIHSFDHPDKGVNLSYTDTDLALGRYDYQVMVYVGQSSSDQWDWSTRITGVIGQLPAEFEEGDVSTSVEGTNITFRFTMPSVSEKGEQLTMPMYANIQEALDTWPISFNQIHKFVDLTPGQTVEYVLENAKKGNHSYMLVAGTEAGENSNYFISVFVGKDVPASPENAKARLTDEGVLITWEAPTRGSVGGDMGDPNELTYWVTRKTSAFDEGVMVAGDIKELSFTDVFKPETETVFFYEIFASNSEGDGPAASTNKVVAGPTTPLPFVENFDAEDGYGGCTFENNTWIKSTSSFYCTWNNASESLYINDKVTAPPHNGNGFAYAMYSGWNSPCQWDAITTGHLNLTGANAPKLTFWYYDLANGGSDMMLQALTTTDDGETYEEVLSIALGNAEETGWKQAVVYLDAIKEAPNAQVCIKTVVDGKNVWAVAIDELSIENDEEVGVKEINSTSAPLTRYNLQGQPAGTRHKGVVITNGKKHLEQ